LVFRDHRSPGNGGQRRAGRCLGGVLHVAWR
jgi:hypothetical protein